MFGKEDFTTFYGTLVDCLFRPVAIASKRGADFKVGLVFFTILSLVALGLSWGINTAVMSYEFMSVDVEAALGGLPDFEIVNGSLTLVKDVQQPFWVSENIVVDTTDQITDAPNSARGGILITDTAVITSDGYAQQVYNISDFGEIAPNKGRLVEAVDNFIPVIILILSVLTLIFRVIGWVLICGLMIITFTCLGKVFSFFAKKNINAKEYVTVSLYCISPYLVLSTLGDLFFEWLGLVGVIWSFVVFALVVREINKG